MKILNFVLIWMLGFASPTEMTQSPWDLKKNKNGVKVYTRYIEGTNIKEFKVIGEIDASVTAVTAVIKDFQNFKNWVRNLSVTKVLGRPAADTEIRYLEIDMPWPISNRDAITRSAFTYNASNKSVKVNITSAEDHIAEKSGIVRVRGSKGHYLIKPKKNGKVEFTYQFYSNPGGNIPAWVINSTLSSVAYGTITNLRKEVKKPEYQNRTFSFME